MFLDGSYEFVVIVGFGFKITVESGFSAVYVF